MWEKITHSGKNHAILFMDTVFRGYQTGVIGNFFEIDFNPTHYRQFAGARWWLKLEVNAYIAALKEKEDQRPGFLLQKAVEYEELNKRFLGWSIPFREHNFFTLSNQEIKAIFTIFIQHLSKINALVYTSIILDRFYTDDIVKIIAKKEKDYGRQKEILKNIFQIEWGLQLHLKMEQLLKFAEMGSLNDAAIKEYLAKFGHLNLVAFHGKLDTIEDLRKDINNLKVAQEKKRLEELKQQNLKPLLEHLHLSPPEIIKIQTLRKWTFIANNDDHYVMGSIACFWDLWCEIARRLNLTFEQFISMTVTEAEEALESGFLPEKVKGSLQSRFQISAMVWENCPVKILIGKELKKYNQKEQQEEAPFHATKEIKGTPASPGYALGTVQLLTDIRDLHKIKEGNILVAIYTYPAIVVAMEKAAAIVTDQGGLLSHAAIISRELKKPCVVGTEIATKVFRDGDLVEVDAEKGVVRKIK